MPAAIRIIVDPTSLNRLATKVGTLPATFKHLAETYGLPAAAKVVLDGVKELTPEGPTGRAKKAWKIQTRQGSVIAITNDVRSQKRSSAGFPYAVVLQTGSGIYGPNRRVIYPQRTKIFKWREGSYVHRARKVRGRRPVGFERAVNYRKINPILERTVLKHLETFLKQGV
jgi:hypothetical protein